MGVVLWNTKKKSVQGFFMVFTQKCVKGVQNQGSVFRMTSL